MFVFMKKTFFILLGLVLSTAAFAQFEKGTKYAGLSTTGLGLSYDGANKCVFALGAQGGYFFMDNVAALATVGFNSNGNDVPASYDLGLQGRYYIKQNGIYLGAGVKYKHFDSYNDVMPGIEVGYAFYLNHYITIEPAIYYDQSFKNHSDYSKIGLKIGAGFYF